MSTTVRDRFDEMADLVILDLASSSKGPFHERRAHAIICTAIRDAYDRGTEEGANGVRAVLA